MFPFLPPENQGIWNGNIGQKWINVTIVLTFWGQAFFYQKTLLKACNFTKSELYQDCFPGNILKLSEQIFYRPTLDSYFC